MKILNKDRYWYIFTVCSVCRRLNYHSSIRFTEFSIETSCLHAFQRHTLITFFRIWGTEFSYSCQKCMNRGEISHKRTLFHSLKRNGGSFIKFVQQLKLLYIKRAQGTPTHPSYFFFPFCIYEYK